MVDRERRILYDLSVHAEVESRCTNEPAGLEEQPGYGQRFFGWGPNLQRVGSLLGYFSVPPALREHVGLRPAYSLHASPDGEHVAILTREGLFVRSRDANFEGADDEPTWAVPLECDGRLGEWQVAWEALGGALAVATATGQMYVLERSGETVCSRAAPLGLAGAVFCGSAEVLCVTHDGKLYRLGVGSADSGAHLPPASASVLQGAGGGTRAVVGCICIDAARNAMFVGGAAQGLPSLSRWRAAPGAEITPLPFQFGVAEELPAPNPSFSMPREDGQSQLHACCQVRVSPSGRLVAAADSGGRVMVWPADGSSAPTACGNADSVTDVAWWGDDALSMAQRAGAVSIDALADSANLLGDPEVFNPFSTICCVKGGEEQHRLMILEGPELEDVQEGGGIGTLALCRLQQTTPAEKFAVQLEQKEYGSALQLAQYYGLSTDDVYKAQWLDVPVSKETNADYLSKVKEAGWALLQCVNRVVDTGKGARCLLDHGMSLTHLPRLQQFVSAPGPAADVAADAADMEPEPEEDDAEPEPEEPFGLTPDEKELCRIRAELVRHRNRLSTHIEIQRGYNRDVYLRFRDATLMDEAMEYALRGDIKGVELLLTHHGTEDDGSLLAQRLTIVKNLPETARPKSYAKLLPAVDGEKMCDMLLRQWHAEDYVEAVTARALWSPGDAGTVSVDQPNVTAAEVTAWYTERALEIDERSGQLYIIQELLQQGVKHGVLGLEALAQTVKELIDIVERGTASVDMTIPQYERLTPEHRLSCFIGDCNETTIADAVFVQAKGLLQSNSGLLEEFMLSKATTEFEIPAAVFLHGDAPQSKGELVKSGIFSAESDFIRTVLECIYGCKRTDIWELLWKVWESVAIRNKEKARSDLGYRDMHRMLDKLEGRLEAAHIMSSFYKMRYEVIFFGNDDVQATLDVVKGGEWNASEAGSLGGKRNAGSNMEKTFKFLLLPAAVQLQILGDTRLRKAQDKVRLVCTQWRKHAAKIQSVHQVLRSLPRSISTRSLEVGSAGLKMIQHVQFLHDIFCCVPYEDALLYCLEGLLVKGYHTTAQQLIDGTLPMIEGLRPIEALHDSDSDVLDPMTATRIGHVALNAARELVNGSNDLRECKEDCKAARACLSVIGHMHDHFSRGFMTKLEDEENFIEGIQGLSGFRMASYKLPLQVRQCEDKMLVLREILEGQDVYANVDEVVDLFDTLGLSDQEDQLKVQAEMAQFAFQTGDMRIACDQTLSLIDAGFSGAWSLGHTIGKMWISDTAEMNQPSSITSCDNATKMLAVAVHHCPAEVLPKVLSDWRRCDELVAEHGDDGFGKMLGQVEQRIEQRMHQAEGLVTGLAGAGQNIMSVFRPLHAAPATQQKARPASPEAETMAAVAPSGVHPFYAVRVSDAVAAQAQCAEATRSGLPASTVDAVTAWVAANTCDLPLCVAVLMDLPEPRQIEDVLNRLVQTSTINSALECTLGLTCFSLSLIGTKEGHSGVQKALASSEDEMGAIAVGYAVSASSDADAAVSYCAQRVTHYHETAGDAELQSVLDVTRVDREKFFMDEDYQASEIARLITGGYETECERLLEFMDIPLWYMHSQLLQQRMLTQGDDTPAEWTRDRQSLLSEPVEMENVLREKVLVNLNGTQHNRLLVCLDLLSECCQLNSRGDRASIETHVKSLRAVQSTPESFRQGLDYCLVVGTKDFSTTEAPSRDAITTLLVSRLSAENVAGVADGLSGHVTLQGGESVNSSLIYRAYVESELEKCENIDNEWHRLSKQLAQCDVLDTLAVCQRTCDLEKWPLAVCSRVLADGIKLADAKIVKSKDPNAAELIQPVKKQSVYLKGLLKLAKDGHGEWLEYLQTSLDVLTVRSSLEQMAAVGCPESVLASATENFLSLTSEEVTVEQVSAEVAKVYAAAIDLSMSSYTLGGAPLDAQVQRTALAACLFQQFKLPFQPKVEDANLGGDAGVEKTSTAYWNSPPACGGDDNTQATTAVWSVERLLTRTCTAEVSERMAKKMCAHLVERWCAADVPCSPSETSGTSAPAVALLAMRVVNPEAASEYSTELLYYVASFLLQEVVGWNPSSDDVEALISKAAGDSSDGCEGKTSLLIKMFEMQTAGEDWSPVLRASVVLVKLFADEAGLSGEDKLWAVLLQAIVQHGDVETWVEPTTVACVETYRAQRAALSLEQYQGIISLLLARADAEWAEGKSIEAGRLEAVAAALGLGAGYDDQGLTDQVVARLTGLPASRLAAWPRTGADGVEAGVMASLVEKGRVVQLATTVLWCGGAPEPGVEFSRSAALLLDYTVAVRSNHTRPLLAASSGFSCC